VCEGDALCPEHYAQLVALVNAPPEPVPALVEAFKRLRQHGAEQPKVRCPLSTCGEEASRAGVHLGEPLYQCRKCRFNFVEQPKP
jgi:transposase-like protein